MYKRQVLVHRSETWAIEILSKQKPAAVFVCFLCAHVMARVQVEGVKFALRHGGRVLLADEMGLGKTIQVQLTGSPPA